MLQAAQKSNVCFSHLTVRFGPWAHQALGRAHHREGLPAARLPIPAMRAVTAFRATRKLDDQAWASFVAAGSREASAFCSMEHLDTAAKDASRANF